MLDQQEGAVHCNHIGILPCGCRDPWWLFSFIAVSWWPALQASRSKVGQAALLPLAASLQAMSLPERMDDAGS
jgi:hypothetical protein